MTVGFSVTIGPNIVIRRNDTIIGYNRYQGCHQEFDGLIGKAVWCNGSKGTILSDGAM